MRCLVHYHMIMCIINFLARPTALQQNTSLKGLHDDESGCMLDNVKLVLLTVCSKKKKNSVAHLTYEVTEVKFLKGTAANLSQRVKERVENGHKLNYDFWHRKTLLKF